MNKKYVWGNITIELSIRKYVFRFHILHFPKGKNTLSVLFLLNFGYEEPVHCFDPDHKRRDLFFWVDVLRFNVKDSFRYKAHGVSYRIK